MQPDVKGEVAEVRGDVLRIRVTKSEIVVDDPVGLRLAVFNDAGYKGEATVMRQVGDEYVCRFSGEGKPVIGDSAKTYL